MTPEHVSRSEGGDAPRASSKSPPSGAWQGDVADEREMRLVRLIVDSRTKGRSSAATDEAWTTLLETHQDRLFAVCMRMVRDQEIARDLTQDALVRIIQGLDSYDGRARLSTWMIRITMNVCLSYLRKQKLRRHASLDAPLGPDTGEGARTTGASSVEQNREPGAGERIENDERRRLIVAAMDVMEADHKSVLVLRDIRGLDYREIADVLGLPIGTIKSRLFRARAALRAEIERIRAESGASNTEDDS
ncbi:MAG: RNA polymerase sigma factor [Phycisphaerales bacterium]|nr:MAG: RNA polymerase sigma factor [Phycisphaerales bacterium]